MAILNSPSCSPGFCDSSIISPLLSQRALPSSRAPCLISPLQTERQISYRLENELNIVCDSSYLCSLAWNKSNVSTGTANETHILSCIIWRSAAFQHMLVEATSSAFREGENWNLESRPVEHVFHYPSRACGVRGYLHRTGTGVLCCCFGNA